MSTSTLLTVAAVQPTPVFLDREATVERLVASIKEAGAAGARLIALPKAIVPGDPDWVWRLPAWKDHDWYERLHDQAVDVPGPTTDALGAAAAEASAWVAVGINERTRSGTLYNSLLYLSPDGAVAGVHRKLLPTGGERTVWGCGDGSTLTVQIGMEVDVHRGSRARLLSPGGGGDPCPLLAVDPHDEAAARAEHLPRMSQRRTRFSPL